MEMGEGVWPIRYAYEGGKALDYVVKYYPFSRRQELGVASYKELGMESGQLWAAAV